MKENRTEGPGRWEAKQDKSSPGGKWEKYLKKKMSNCKEKMLNADRVNKGLRIDNGI